MDILGTKDITSYEFEDITLLELLDWKYNITVQKAVYTKYVKCLEDVCSNDEYSWLFEVNGKPMNVGADDYYLQDGDEVLFSYKKI